MVDIVEQDNVCYGIVCRVSKEAMPHLITISAKDTVWACGGIGGLYTHSTNFPHLTGDALALSLRHHIELEILIISRFIRQHCIPKSREEDF